MFSIGGLSKKTKVKIPTIRYYEEAGLLAAPERTNGNQRRYDQAGLERLSFIKHARELGFSIEAILSLIELQEHPDRSCDEATAIATAQLSDVRAKIKKLRSLEKELKRISDCCDGSGLSEDCNVLTALADHTLCIHPSHG
ncbi:MerR family transcriptional regulator [Octadecabacter ascidiaceicola]|uniref:HTH-type transcriptional regulator ZntR n=1 Tax=Octadecabacter ascidiaceicola TaxID=1655543 RepID=A0A238KU68_9RHOB|nr:helix-turn-helix domain-containing protein [Octadecabacter ascidiaceicola]SMX45576.1 HTH-type transcriptional regulator ZntR [Octadecabacter ascidiaceicola]